MSDTKVLRDHSLPCEHRGTYAVHLNGEFWWCTECPGGKEIILRRERVKIAVAAEPWESMPSQEMWVADE